jgi:hypothetical protein
MILTDVKNERGVERYCLVIKKQSENMREISEMNFI